jgi:hypothetical protein
MEVCESVTRDNTPPYDHDEMTSHATAFSLPFNSTHTHTINPPPPHYSHLGSNWVVECERASK